MLHFYNYLLVLRNIYIYSNNCVALLVAVKFPRRELVEVLLNLSKIVCNLLIKLLSARLFDISNPLTDWLTKNLGQNVSCFLPLFPLVCFFSSFLPLFLLFIFPPKSLKFSPKLHFKPKREIVFCPMLDLQRADSTRP